MYIINYLFNVSLLECIMDKQSDNYDHNNSMTTWTFGEMLPLMAARWVSQALFQALPSYVLIIDTTHDNEILCSAT